MESEEIEGASFPHSPTAGVRFLRTDIDQFFVWDGEQWQGDGFPIYPDTIYLYDPESNPAGASLPGIPLRHLRQGDVESLPAHIIRSIEACGFYALAPRIEE